MVQPWEELLLLMQQLLIGDAVHYLPGKLKVLAITQFMPPAYQLDPDVDWHICNTILDVALSA